MPLPDDACWVISRKTLESIGQLCAPKVVGGLCPLLLCSELALP